LADHTETIQIDYDPTRISYEKLLEIFWSAHTPTRRPWSQQYKAAVFFHNQEQKRLALASLKSQAAKTKGKIYTEIIPASEFYLAEAYHQKYQLQRDDRLLKELRGIYPATQDFVNSTAAARVNGYLGGYGTLAAVQAELPNLGLSPEANRRILDMVENHNRRGWLSSG
jgi:peptide-methionine (S)-S-oxide reductase